jgi:glc operon protein GlcG
MKTIRSFFTAFIFATLFQNASAQTAVIKSLTLDGAEKVMMAATRFAKDNKAPGASIAIVDVTGSLVMLHRLDGSFPASAEVAFHKANTAATFKLPTIKLEDAINNGRTALTTVGHVFLKGGIPIVVDGQVVGAIGVSGAASADQDQQIAEAGAGAKLTL